MLNTARVAGARLRLLALPLGGITSPRAVFGVAAAALALVVLFSATQLALVVPKEEQLPSLAEQRALERPVKRPGVFEQLRAGFVARVLGFEAAGSLVGSRKPDNHPSILKSSPRTVVAHPFNNDEMGDAFAAASIPFTARTNTTRATRRDDEPDSCAPTGGTVWYKYQAASNSHLVATTFGSDHPTALAAFEADHLDRLREVGCDADALGASQVVFAGAQGRTYLFQVSAPTGGGALVFNLDPLGLTRRVSVSSSGTQGDDTSQYPSISADGRYIAFHSKAQNLVLGDDNTCPGYGRCPDIFVHDTVTRRTERVSVSSRGEQANHASLYPGISGDGRFVGFLSFASNLVPADTNGQWDVFVRDRFMGTTERVSVDSQGRQGRHAVDTQWSDPNAQAASISLSHDGRYVAFASDFPNLVQNDKNACFDTGTIDWWASGAPRPEPPARIPVDAPAYPCRDIFVRDRLLGKTTRVSVASDGFEAEGDSAGAYITPDGRYVAFGSDAENLDPRDGNFFRDVFVHDRLAGTTELVSLSSTGSQGNSNSGGINEHGDVSISNDARYVAFVSNASNFGPSDTNDQDVFLRDRVTGRTIQLPGTYDEDESRDRPTAIHATGLHAVISGDGRFVASTYTVLVIRGPELRNRGHILVYDRLAERTTRVSVSSSGAEADGLCMVPDLSDDGRAVAFHCQARNLDGEDANGSTEDVYLHEMTWAR